MDSFSNINKASKHCLKCFANDIRIFKVIRQNMYFRGRHKLCDETVLSEMTVCNTDSSVTILDKYDEPKFSFLSRFFCKRCNG